jgi:hypothetical protein
MGTLNMKQIFIGLFCFYTTINLILCSKPENQNIKEEQEQNEISKINKPRENINNSLNKSESKKITIQYNCLANGTADINLALYNDNSLRLYFKSLLDENSDEYNIDGKWERSKDDLRLMFYKKTLPKMSWLFDNSYVKDSPPYKFPNDSTVLINSQQEILWLWGVACKKE